MNVLTRAGCPLIYYTERNHCSSASHHNSQLHYSRSDGVRSTRRTDSAAKWDSHTPVTHWQSHTSLTVEGGGARGRGGGGKTRWKHQWLCDDDDGLRYRVRPGLVEHPGGLSDKRKHSEESGVGGWGGGGGSRLDLGPHGGWVIYGLHLQSNEQRPDHSLSWLCSYQSPQDGWGGADGGSYWNFLQFSVQVLSKYYRGVLRMFTEYRCKTGAEIMKRRSLVLD